MSHQSLAQLQQENDRLLSEWNRAAADCERLQAELTDLRSRLQLCEQSATTRHDDRASVEHRLLEATAIATNSLLTIANFDQAVNKALQILGEALETDRVCLIENFAASLDSPYPNWRILQEWDSPGTVSQLAHTEMSQGSWLEIEQWYELCSRGQSVSCLLEDMPQPFRRGSAEIGIKVLHVVPIFVENKWWGVVGFDDCREVKHRSVAELSILKIAADCIGSAVERQRTQQALVEAEQARVADLTRANEELRQRDRLLEATAIATDTLLTIAPFDTAVNTALQILGEALETDRVKILECVFDGASNTSPAYYAMSYEWITAGTISQLSHPSSSRISICGAEEFMERLYQSGGFGGLLCEWPEVFWSAFEAVQAKAIYCVPIRVEGQLWGALVFDDCYEPKYRSAAELSVLRIAADCIGSAIQRQRTQQALLQAEQARSQELERHNAELQQTLDRLAESEKRYRQLMELASEGIFRVEYEQPIPIDLPVKEQAKQIYQHFCIKEHNLAYAQMFGYDQPNAMVNARLTDVHIMDAPENAIQMEQFVRNGHQMRNQETVEVDRFGRKRYFLNNAVDIIQDGFAIGGWGTQIDITELREAQQALLEAEQARSQELERHNAELQQTLDRLTESEQRFQTLFDLSSEGFYYTEVNPPCPISLPIEEQCDLLYRNIRVVKANPAFAAMYGVDDPDELIGLRNADVHVADSQKNAVFIRDTITNGYRFRNLETEEIDKQGRRRYFLNSGVYTIRDGFAISGWSTQIDITELRETQQALLEAEQERVAELSQVNAALAQANVEIVEREWEKSQLLDITHAIAQIQDSTTLLQTIYRDIQPIFGFDNATIVLLEPDQQSFRVLYHDSSADFPEVAALFSQPISIAGTPLEKGFFEQPDVYIVKVDEWLQEYPDYPGLQIAQQLGLREIFVSKLYSGGDVFGEIELVYKHPPQFDESFRKLFENFANQVAVVVANILANEAILEREREKAILLEITQAIAQINDTQTLFEVIYSQLQPIFRFDAASVVVLEDDASAYRVLYYDHDSAFDQFFAESISLAGSPFAEAFSPTTADIFLADVDEWLSRYPQYEGLQLAKQVGYQKILVGKLYNGGKLMGLVELAYQQPPVLDEAFHKLFENFVQQVAVAVANILANQKIITQQAALLRAEQDRVAELAKTNTALKNSLDRLAANPNLNAFLGHVLLEIVQQFEIAIGHLWLYDAASQSLSLHLRVSAGQVQLQHEFEDIPSAFRNPSIDDLPIWEALLQTRQPFVITRENAPQYVFRGTLEWQIQQEECQTGINLLLTLQDEPIGLLALVSTRRSFTPEELELAQALAHQATLALQLTRLAEAAKQAAIAREQEQAAQERAAHLARANAALQKTIDELGSIQQIEELIPVALRIVAESFQTPHCAFYEISKDNSIYLRYYFTDDQVLNSSELLALDPKNQPVLIQLAGGFTVPDEYLGTPPRYHNHAAYVDHAAGSCVPEFDRYCRHQGWESELNVPLVIGDTCEGALVIYRSVGLSYSESEIALAETLSAQLALALQVSRLAEEAKQAAIAREQEKAAQERAAELAKANEVLKRSVDVLATETDLNQFIGHVLRLAAQQFDAPLAEYWQVTNPNIARIVGWWGHNQIHGFGQHHDHPANESGVQVPSYMLEQRQFSDRRKHFVAPFDHSVQPAQGAFLSDPASWYEAFGVSVQLNLPLIVGETCFGVLNFWQPSDRPFAEQQIELGYALAQQVTLAIRLSQLAEEVKQAAIAREQEKAAQERAAELAKANEALARTSSRLAEQPDLSGFLTHLMFEAMAQVEADGGHLTIYDKQRDVISTAVLIEHGETVQAPAFPPEMPVEQVGFIQLIRQTRKPRYFNLEVNFEQDAHLLWTGVGEYHKQHNHAAGIAIPLFAGDEFLGHFGLAFTQQKLLSEQSAELLQALAHQASLAIQLTQLAEEAKQAAIAREQEKAAQERAAELAKANEALKRSVSRLSEQPELNGFLGHVLTEAAEQIGACSNALFLYDEASHILLMKTIYLHGQMADVATDPRLEIFCQPVPADVSPAWEAIKSGWVVTHEANGTDPNSHPQRPEWHQEMGHETVIAVPLVVGGKPIGFMAPCFREWIEPSIEQIELVQSLAHQATLALELTRLAEEAKQAAIAREQEKAAQERAAELAKANNALRRSARNIVQNSSIENILPLFLREAIAASGASAGAVLRRVGESEFEFVAILQGDDLINGERLKAHPFYNAVMQVSREDSAGWFTRLAAGETLWRLADDRQAGLFPEAEEYHRSYQQRALWDIPYKIGDRVAGYLGLAFCTDEGPSQIVTETVTALATQVGLALELTELAEEAKQAAIAREQEKAAQERAAELAKANEALKRSLSSLSADQSLDRFLANVMVSLSSQFNSTTAEYWSHPDGQTAYIQMLIWEGKVYTRDEIAKHYPDNPGVPGFLVPPELIFGEPLNRRTKHFVIEDFSTHSIGRYVQWMPAQGLYKELNIPLNVGEETIGALIVRMQRDFEITEEKVELAWALANQVALALELTRLAEEAKQAAIAREQEKAAQERAAELAKANDALKRSLDSLASEPSLDKFLGQVLTAIAEQFDSPLAEYWYHPDDTAYIGMASWHGQIYSREEFSKLYPTHPGVTGYKVPPEQIHGEPLQRRKRYFITEDWFANPFTKDYTWHPEHELYKEINVPMVLGDECIGALVVRMTRDQQITTQQIELAQALAHQATLAAQLTQLAEEAKQAAIAREQEKAAQERAAELAKANEALARTSSRLAEQPDLAGFLSHITIEAITQLGADAGHLTILNERRQTLRTVAHVEQDRLLARDHMAPEMPIAEAGFLQLLLETRKPRYFDLEQEAHLFWPGAIEFHRQRYHRAVLSVPLYAGGKFLGHLGLAFTHSNPISEQGSELLQALSHQAALAIQLTQLAEEAKQAAIAREQEKAAQERAAELAKANEVLRRTASQLVKQQDLDHFLQSVMFEVAQETEAVNNSIFLYNSQANTLLMHSAIQDGQVINLETDPRFELWRTPIPADITEGWGQTQSRGYVWHSLESNAVAGDEIWDISIPWHRMMGHRFVISVLLQVGDEPMGFMGLCFRNEVHLSAERIELVQALAQQAALAIQLTRLAEAAKQAAIAREQEKAALERAAELAKVNEALRRSATSLAAITNIDDILTVFLREAITASGASAGAVLRRVEGTEFEFVAILQDDELLRGELLQSHPFSIAVREWTRHDQTGYFTNVANGQTMWWKLTPDDVTWFPEATEYHRTHGHRAVWDIPFTTGTEVFGYLGLAFRTTDSPSQVAAEAIAALSNQVAVALELTRLAEEAKQAAIAREQEKAAQERAAELAKANATLRRSLSWLANEKDLNQFLKRVLLEIASTTQADVAHLFVLREPERMLEVAARVIDGAISDHPASTELPLFAAPFPADITSAFRYMEEQNLFLTLDIALFQPEVTEMLWPGALDWHVREGHKQIASQVLKAGDHGVGFLGLAFCEQREFSQEERELVNALANQAALAVLLTQLAEEAKQAAIAREQEKAAQERAAELVKANNALRRSIGHLTTTDNLYRFLIATLEEAIQVSDAASGAIFVYQPATLTLQMIALLLHGETIDIASDPRTELWRSSIPTSITPFWQQLQNQEIIWTEIEQPSSKLWQFPVAWHQQQGHKTIPMIPLAIGETVLGFMGLAFTTGEKPSRFRFEQCRTFAHHAALALQMADLMQQAKQSAVLEERNHMAREIHDTLAQDFVGILMQLQAVTRLLASNPDQAQAHLTRASDLARTGLAEARRSVWVLRQDSTEYSDFAQILNQLTEQLTISSPVQTQVQLQGTPYPLPPEAGMNLLRIAQEAITNVLRHANAQHIELHLIYTADYVQLCIRDDGHGFDPQPLTRGFGLMGMQQRADLIGAHLHIHSSPTTGTLVEVLLPSASLHQASNRNYG